MAPKEVKDLILKRATFKRKITLLTRKIESDESLFTANKSIIEDYLSRIEELDGIVNDAYLSLNNLGVEISDEHGTELDSQTEYNMDVRNFLSSFSATDVAGSDQTSCRMKLPELKCETFNGEGTSNLQFHSFISQFNNILGNRKEVSKSTKLTYLKSYLLT